MFINNKNDSNRQKKLLFDRSFIIFNSYEEKEIRVKLIILLTIHLLEDQFSLLTSIYHYNFTFLFDQSNIYCQLTAYK